MDPKHDRHQGGTVNYDDIGDINDDDDDDDDDDFGDDDDDDDIFSSSQWTPNTIGTRGGQ